MIPPTRPPLIRDPRTFLRPSSCVDYSQMSASRTRQGEAQKRQGSCPLLVPKLIFSIGQPASRVLVACARQKRQGSCPLPVPKNNFSIYKKTQTSRVACFAGSCRVNDVVEPESLKRCGGRTLTSRLACFFCCCPKAKAWKNPN